MAIQPFTPAGLTAKLTELYALSDSALLLEAQLASTSLVAWFDANFSLTTEQDAYLADMSAADHLTFGCLLAAALITRSPIVMGAIPANPIPRRTKELRQNIMGSLQWDNGIKSLGGYVNLDLTWVLLP